MSTPPLSALDRPSTWFVWHDYLITPGVRVLDLACGRGRHGVAAAKRGAEVVAVDRDEATLAEAKAAAGQAGVTAEFRQVDLEAPWPDLGQFDIILLFNYLDRARMDDIRERLTPGGVLVMETYLLAQRDLGWGPQSEDHLLQPGELPGLVAPLDVIHCREVVEPINSQQWRAVGSVVAQKR